MKYQIKYQTAEEMKHPTDTAGNLMFDLHCPYCWQGRTHPFGQEQKKAEDYLNGV